MPELEPRSTHTLQRMFERNPGVRSPLMLSKIREKIVAALRPGGYLLLGTFDPSEETYWSSRYLIRGGKRITRFFAAHRKLPMLDSNTLPCPRYEFIDALLQKAQ